MMIQGQYYTLRHYLGDHLKYQSFFITLIVKMTKTSQRGVSFRHYKELLDHSHLVKNLIHLDKIIGDFAAKNLDKDTIINILLILNSYND